MSHRYLVVMLGSTARVSTLAEALVVAEGRGAVIFKSCDGCAAWESTPVMRVEAEFEQAFS